MARHYEAFMAGEKPCNCGKKKFSNTPLKNQAPINKAMTMVQGYSMAIASRGFRDKKVEPVTKQLRVLSCFGNEAKGGELPPCAHLKASETPGKFICGACGCGDKKGTWLLEEDGSYAKLDYPVLKCPIGMPGFSNYIPSTPEEAKEPISRKHYIENSDLSVVQKVEVTTPEPPEEVEKAFAEIANMRLEQMRIAGVSVHT
jgi:hypothetical protein